MTDTTESQLPPGDTPGAGPERPESEDREMSFLEHLEELRRCLLIGIGSVGITTALCMLLFRQPLMDWLVGPVESLHALSMTETILTQFKISIVLGIFISFPILVWQIWRFVAPGLYKHERKYLVYFVVFSWIFFILGGGFARYVMLPFCVGFFETLTIKTNPYARGANAIDWEDFEAHLEETSYDSAILAGNQLVLVGEDRSDRVAVRTSLDAALAVYRLGLAGIPMVRENVGTNLDNVWSLSSYTSFSFWTILIFGIVFDLPVAMSLLTIMGIVNHRFLSKNRKYGYLIILIMSAIFTPQDIFTMIIMALPLFVLYEISIVASWWFGRKRLKEQEAMAAGEGSD